MGGAVKPKYWAEVIKQIDNGKGYWAYLDVGVFTDDYGQKKLVGEYLRNYSSMGDFCWFTSGGKDYALYSKDYTATRIMSLPDCKDLGGEEPKSSGFCPVEYYVPSFIEHRFKVTEKNGKIGGDQFKTYEPDTAGADIGDDVELSKGLSHEPFGFVAGCVWGDDSSWKCEFLDLSKASEGKIIREARFGYLELPEGVKLKDAVRMDCSDETGRIIIASQASYDLSNGKKAD